MRRIAFAAMALLVLVTGGCRAVSDKDPESAACNYEWTPDPTKADPEAIEKGTLVIKITSGPGDHLVAFEGRIMRKDHPTTWIGKGGVKETTQMEWTARTPYSVTVKYRANSPFTVEIDATLIDATGDWVRCTIIDAKAEPLASPASLT
jgi:hypothetical protein